MDDEAAWQQVTENIGLVKWCVNKFLTGGSDSHTFDELFTAAAIAAFKAAHTHNPSKGERSTYYWVAIRNALVSEVRSLGLGERVRDTHRRYSFLGRAGSIEDLMAGLEMSDNPGQAGLASALNTASAVEFEDELVEDMDRGQVVRDAVMHLPQRYQEIIVARYWEGLTFRQIGERHGVTKQAIEQRYRKAEALLRQMLAPLDIEDAT